MKDDITGSIKEYSCAFIDGTGRGLPAHIRK
jgi:hypothetical protein